MNNNIFCKKIVFHTNKRSQIQSDMAENSRPNDIITLDVGGTIFTTTKSTINKYKEDMLSKAINKGSTFFDRDPTIFSYILNYYRSGVLDFPKSIPRSLINAELDFWGIDELAECPSQYKEENIEFAVQFCDWFLSFETDNMMFMDDFTNSDLIIQLPTFLFPGWCDIKLNLSEPDPEDDYPRIGYYILRMAMNLGLVAFPSELEMKAKSLKQKGECVLPSDFYKDFVGCPVVVNFDKVKEYQEIFRNEDPPKEFEGYKFDLNEYEKREYPTENLFEIFYGPSHLLSEEDLNNMVVRYDVLKVLRTIYRFVYFKIKYNHKMIHNTEVLNCISKILYRRGWKFSWKKISYMCSNDFEYCKWSFIVLFQKKGFDHKFSTLCAKCMRYDIDKPCGNMTDELLTFNLVKL